MATVTISTRLEEREADELDQLAKREGLDRASILKSLLRRGMKEALFEDAVTAYRSGSITLSRASELSGLSTWDFLSRMPREGLELNYDAEAFEADLAQIEA